MTLFACCGLTRLAAAGEDSTAVWWRESHPIVVVIVVDGLRGDALEGDAPWDGPLMPRMRSERNQCLRWTDVWTEFTDRDANYRQLLTGCSPANALVEKESVSVAFTSKTMASEIWAPESESFDLDELRARLDRAVSADHGTVLVLRLRDLVFPLRVDVRTLQRLDPRPWSTNSAGPVEIKELTAKRLRQAIHVARSEQPLDVKFSDYSLAIYQWVVDAGHRVLDRKLDHILRQLSKSVPPERLGWILTSTGATAYRRHGLGTMGQSAVAEDLRVPLWWHFPQHLESSGVREEAHLLRDLTRTLEAWSEDQLGRGLFGPPQGDRFAFASGLRRTETGWQGFSQMRWATEDFALLDLTGPPPRIELFDRRIDPSERTPRGSESQAIWDSLRSELCDRTLGAEVELRVRTDLDAGSEIRFGIDAEPAQLKVGGNAAATIVPDAGGSLVRWTVPESPSPSLRIVVPSSSAGLRIRRSWAGCDRIALGAVPQEIPPEGELRITPNTPLFSRMLHAPASGSARLSMQWTANGWWTGN